MLRLAQSSWNTLGCLYLGRMSFPLTTGLSYNNNFTDFEKQNPKTPKPQNPKTPRFISE